ncbi:MAG TPA: peptidoglycan DD-metalloendopeptidase family protein [Actinomycetota bacterium]|nr:peptidoglycan DD-metalloendopeptidase family protein [Actinomycetota bacterium]
MQRERLGRVLIAATVLCTLLVPAVTSPAGQRKKLDETRQQLETVRENLDRKSARAGSLRSHIRRLEREINTIQIAVNKLNGQIATVESEVRTVEAHIKATQKKIDAVEDRATEQAVMLYKQGSTEVIDALLQSESLAELDEKAAMLGVAAQENTGALIRYGRLKVEIQEQNRILLGKKEELSEKLRGRSKLLAEMEERKADLDDAYAQVQAEVARLRDREGDLEQAAEDIRNEIIAAQAQRSVTSLGESNQGFIWPLNGPVTSGYGPRWGRMHTGIDIDGYTGQPVVAAKGGSVILASSYSGYGNAVIVDHGGGIATLYAHFSGFAVGAGQSVKQGQVVGYVGCTGSCTGDHLHFEVRVNGSPVNPMSYLP